MYEMSSHFAKTVKYLSIITLTCIQFYIYNRWHDCGYNSSCFFQLVSWCVYCSSSLTISAGSGCTESTAFLQPDCNLSKVTIRTLCVCVCVWQLKPNKS